MKGGHLFVLEQLTAFGFPGNNLAKYTGFFIHGSGP
jgi:hypothetical protein